MSHQIKALSDETCGAWEEYVARRRSATFFHGTGWRRVLETTFGHRPCHLYAERDGRICGVLPLFHVRSRLFGNRLASSPFCVAGHPLADTPEISDDLDRGAVRLMGELGAGYVEYRDTSRERPGWVAQGELYAGFEAAMEADGAEQLKRIPRKQRAVLRKALGSSELTWTLDPDERDLFALYAPSVRNLGTPVFPREYFGRLMREFGASCEVLTVRAGTRPVASVLSFYFRDRVMPYYTGSVAEARALGANDFMYWQVMRRAVERGCRVFDFGRSKVDTGPYNFKKNWGFSPRPITHQYHLRETTKLPEVNPANPKYRAFIALWRRLPLPVANALGPILVKGTG